MKLSSTHSLFVQPKFLVGIRALEHIHIELDGYNANRPMVITSKANGKSIINRFFRSLADSNITIGALVDDALPYVNVDEVKRLSGLFHWRKCDSIIALGGESVMDIAKSLNLIINNIQLKSPLDIHSPLTPLIYIASSTLNGFEASRSVNIDGKIFESDFLFPDIVCIDQRMVSPIADIQQIVYTSMDSLAICIEGADTAQKNPFVDSMSFAAIRLIVDNLRVIAKKPKDRKAAVGLVNGISIAGTIRSNTQGDLCCLSSMVMSRKTGLSQGMLSGLMLAQTIQHKADEGLALRGDLLLAMVGIDKFCSVPREEKLSKAIEEIQSLKSLLSQFFPKNLEELKIQEHFITAISIEIEAISNGRIAQSFAFNFLQKVFNNTEDK